MKTKDLKLLVKGLSSIKLNKCVAILGCVLLERVSGQLKARISNLEEHLSGKILSDGPDFSCFVDAKSFFTSVRSLKSENCSVSMNPENEVIEIRGDKVLKLFCKVYFVRDFVPEPKKTKRCFALFCDRALLMSIDKKFSFATKISSGGMYRCVLFNPVDKGTEVVSTDFHRLIKGNFGFISADAFSLPLLAIKGACKIFKRFTKFYVSNVSRSAVPDFRAFFVSEIFSYSVVLYSHAWPDYDQLFCSQPSQVFSVNREELKEALELALAFPLGFKVGLGPVRVTFNQNIGKLEISRDKFSKEIPITGGTVKYSRMLDARFILDYLKTCESDIDVYPRRIDSVYGPVVFRAKESEINDVCAIMPISD